MIERIIKLVGLQLSSFEQTGDVVKVFIRLLNILSAITDDQVNFIGGWLRLIALPLSTVGGVLS